jgi:hypothetical protein
MKLCVHGTTIERFCLGLEILAKGENAAILEGFCSVVLVVS